MDILLTELNTAVWEEWEHNTRERERDVVSIGGALEVKSLYIMTVLGRLQGPMKTCSWQDARNNVIEDPCMWFREGAKAGEAWSYDHLSGHMINARREESSFTLSEGLMWYRAWTLSCHVTTKRTHVPVAWHRESRPRDEGFKLPRAAWGSLYRGSQWICLIAVWTILLQVDDLISSCCVIKSERSTTASIHW